jgi:hypothetical protein
MLTLIEALAEPNSTNDTGKAAMPLDVMRANRKVKTRTSVGRGFSMRVSIVRLLVSRNLPGGPVCQ